MHEFQLLWFEMETEVQEYCETRERMILNGLSGGLSYSEAVRNFEEYWATIEKYL